ncbi:putative Potassium channel AKT3 [Cocos nucifera]|uniref:Putative Potassium channel AKT3 n=1 Tax=Cocos nucifera TaxID=13894 RepID=A0A8K0NCT1_COCNU|nr:putative Potassium channel AKT3 [Cocos nucifera]
MEAMEIDVPKQEDLFRAAEKGDAALFSSLGEEALHRARSMRNEDGRSLLHVAASSGHPEATDPSVSGVNSKDEEGWAPLHSAASIGNVQIVEMLLDRGEFLIVLHKSWHLDLQL